MILLEPGVLIAAGYRLERPLARGGMGSVWVARHLRLDVDVAIKFMTPEYAASAEARARFEREAKASAQLRSPHVVQVHDYGVESETPYIVMELLEGEDLDTRLKRAGRLSLPDTWFVLDIVCRALARAHEVGLVHRDLKPGNIFLARRAGEETVKVLDFGIAKSMDPMLAGKATKTGTLLGSPFYMSPEQMRRSRLVDHRSDLWAIGVIVYRCVVGRLPFSGEELVDVLVEVCTEPIPPPSHFAPDLPPAIDRFIERALARDMNQRFQSAGELADAFSAIVTPGHDGRHPQPSSHDGGHPHASGHDGGHPHTPGTAPLSHPDIAPASGASHPVDSSGSFTPQPNTLALGPPSAGGVQAGPPLPDNTLAPAGHTFSSPPSQRRRVGRLVGVVSVAAAVGVAGAVLVFRAAQPAQRSGVASVDPSSAASSAAPPAPSARAPSVPTGLSEAPAPAPPASSGVRPSHPPTSGSPQPPAVKGAAKKNADDPLDSR
jgi:serine/threonine protein kinase